jgi:hypothetical protein
MILEDSTSIMTHDICRLRGLQLQYTLVMPLVERTQSGLRKSASVTKVDWLERVAEWESRRRRTCLLLAAAARRSRIMHACDDCDLVRRSPRPRERERDRPAGRRAPCSSIIMRERIIKLRAQSQRATHIYVCRCVFALQKNYKSSFSFFRTRTPAEYWKARAASYESSSTYTHVHKYINATQRMSYISESHSCAFVAYLYAHAAQRTCLSLRLLTMHEWRHEDTFASQTKHRGEKCRFINFLRVNNIETGSPFICHFALLLRWQ